MGRRGLGRLLLGLALVLPAAVLAQPTADEEHRRRSAEIVERPQRFDRELRRRFAGAWAVAAPARARPVFERYLPTLGADGILDVLESMVPHCHGEAHALGKAIYARLRDVGSAVQVCGRRCTSGCLHGVLSEVFLGESASAAPGRHVTLEDVRPALRTICREGAAGGAYEPGNCAHGVGHAVLVLAGYDIGKALAHCHVLGSKPLAHYCASGVFMEHESSLPPHQQAGRPSVHHPCDAHPEFPVACYTYRARDVVRRSQGAVAAAARECASFDPAARRGCFYGLGRAYRTALGGAVEALVEYEPQRADAACRQLGGPHEPACWRARRAGMYGLDKPFHLYHR